MENKPLQNKSLDSLQLVVEEIGKRIVGQKTVIEQVLVCLLARGHCLLEGAPGLAKTLLASSLAETLEQSFQRLQFTPDLMPSDIVGTELLEEIHATGKREFNFIKGPVFTHFLLADEINRTPPKTQAALLEAMQEKQVTYAGKRYSLPDPFFVLATQNPVEQSGTYPLPEAQLDRFLMLVKVDYPSAEEELQVLQRTTGNYSASLKPLLNSEQIIELQQLVKEVVIAPELLEFAVQLVRNTRPLESTHEMINKYVIWGAGPRAGQALVLCAKAKALIAGRFAVTLDDLKSVAASVLRHRILLNFHAEADKQSADAIIEQLWQDSLKGQSFL